jgi:phage regulator Rha-like protein
MELIASVDGATHDLIKQSIHKTKYVVKDNSILLGLSFFVSNKLSYNREQKVDICLDLLVAEQGK